ncbi:MAG: ABC transporter permease [Candidatus Eremiobacteraeota bacterium]|nr:ABC transporter permease [Candidatus Eremiobacteraeota bacterium]MBC5826694.1 ABC transporter permease [Candidatus Eremiobacteraeota bacterium]
MIDRAASRRRPFIGSAAVSAGMAWLAVATLMCLVGPLFWHYDPDAVDVVHQYLAPSSAHILGTDSLGRDEFLRLLLGGRISLLVGLVAAIVSIAIGTLYGTVAGYYGGAIDSTLMRIVDVLLAVPTLFLLLFLSSLFHGSLLSLILVIGITSWLGPARLVRGEVLSLRERDYMQAARSLGASDVRLMFRHLMPNAFGTIVTTATFMVAGAMLAETALSYLTIGVRPPTPSWGNMLSSAQKDIFAGALWLIVPPGLAILLTVCALNFVGDWLRERAA